MAHKMSKKIVLVIAILAIGGAGLAVTLMGQSSQQATADPAEEKTAPDTVKANAAFLNYDMVIGDPDAPVEIIEYAAISCSHCAHFHEDVLPALKEKYLDTGKARLVFRNFVFDNPFDVYASALTRCAAREDFFPTVETFFDYQKVWMKVPEMKAIFESDGREAAIKFAQDQVTETGKMAGFTGAEAKQCLNDQEVIQYLLSVRQTAVEQYDVRSTPTLIIDGKKLERNDLATIEKAIEEAVK